MMLLNRAVHIAPWQGENGEIVLIAVTARGTLLREPLTVALRGDHIAAADALWDELDRADPRVPAKREVAARRGCLAIMR